MYWGINMKGKQPQQNGLARLGAMLQAVGAIGCMIPIIIIFGFIFIVSIWEMLKSMF